MSDDEKQNGTPDDGGPADSLAACFAADESRSSDGQTTPRLDFPVVGVGASAGGLEAYYEFLEALPADTGMAFVLIQHLAPDRKSMMAELLGTHRDARA